MCMEDFQNARDTSSFSGGHSTLNWKKRPQNCILVKTKQFFTYHIIGECCILLPLVSAVSFLVAGRAPSATPAPVPAGSDTPGIIHVLGNNPWLSQPPHKNKKHRQHRRQQLIIIRSQHGPKFEVRTGPLQHGDTRSTFRKRRPGVSENAIRKIHSR